MSIRKGVYPYEYMDDWEKFIETTLPEKDNFYSNLNMEDITDGDNNHVKRVLKDFETKNWVSTMICILEQVYCF